MVYGEDKGPGIAPGALFSSSDLAIWPFGHLVIWSFGHLNAALPRYAAIFALTGLTVANATPSPPTPKLTLNCAGKPRRVERTAVIS